MEKAYLNQNIFGRRLAEEMKRRNITNQELADAIYVSVSAISGYRTGRRVPSMDHVVRICKTISVSSDYLLGITENAKIG